MLKIFINKLSILIPKVIEFRDFLLLNQVKRDFYLFYNVEKTDNLELNKIKFAISEQIKEIESTVKEVEVNIKKISDSKKLLVLQQQNLIKLNKKLDSLQKFIEDDADYEEYQKQFQARRKAREEKKVKLANQANK